MKKVSITNLIVSIIAITVLFGGIQYMEYVKRIIGRTFSVPMSGVVVIFLFPILIGFVISMPSEFRKVNIANMNWNKLLIQGIPALVIAIPWNMLLMALMSLLNITTLNLGQIIILHSRFGPYYVIAGVWFGKVLADCMWQNVNNSFKNSN